MNRSHRSGQWPIVGIVGGVVLLFLLGGSFAVVPAGKRGVVMRFGKVQDRILDEGIHGKLPFVTSVHVMSVRVKRTDINVPVGTKDLQTIDTTLALNWHIDPAQVNRIYQQIGDEDQIVERIINPAISEVLKAATPKKTAEEILKQRSDLKNEVDNELKNRLAKYGLLIDDVSLVNVAFSPEFAKSIEAKQIAEQDAKKADFVAQRAIKEAEAEVNRAKGQAEAQRLQRETLTPTLLQKQAIEKWDGRFPTVMTGEGSLPMINVNPGAIDQARP
jgi:regulator of protease activity HflC (stomatin/prohibitin superfamily)